MIKTMMNNDDENGDAETRLRICDELDKNFMVEAAAGTGKTTSIVNRLVSLVAGGTCQIEQLAAVTFTRKAAAELRERFQSELRLRAAKHASGTPDERAIRDRLLYASDNSSRAFVGTIHSFCATLLRERPIEFGVDPAFRELDEKEDLLLREQAWLENISDLIASDDPLLDKLDELGLDRHLIKQRFNSFIEHRDVYHWPLSQVFISHRPGIPGRGIAGEGFVLRDGLFGFSDRELYRFKQAGGRFVFTAPVPDKLDLALKSRFVGATERFKRYQTWLRALPFTAAVSRVAEDLGLLAIAATSPRTGTPGRGVGEEEQTEVKDLQRKALNYVEGNVTAGALLKAIELLRLQSLDFDSASDLISFFEGLLEVDETEGCTALPPDANAVRVMNLHKAKGLEAPIVFLADTTMKYDHPVICHIDRSGKEAVGYMGITTDNGKSSQYDLGSERVDDLLATIRSVTQSIIWKRSQAALRCYSELPFETLISTVGHPTIVRGVIDLIFEEAPTNTSPTGWVIVDYKTDDLTPDDIPDAVRYYQPQLQLYSQHWTQTTGHPTKEMGLYFTRINRYEFVA